MSFGRSLMSLKITRKLVTVGNSKAVIIPIEWLQTKPGLEHVNLDLRENKIIITQVNKQ